MTIVTTRMVALATDDPAADTDLPIDIWHWLLTLIPILVLLFLYMVRRWRGPEAAPIGVALVVISAVAFFATPLDTIAVAAAKGIWDALPILLVIFAALLLYRVGTAAGAFAALRRGVERYTKDRVFLVLAFGWIFASFAQGIAGFGAPIAIVAPILISLGVKPVYAVVIPLIGHAWAKFFGTLGVGWIATTQVVDIEDETASAAVTAVLLIVPIVAAGVAIAFMVGRMRAVRHALPFILIQSAILGGVQLGMTFISPELSAFVAASVALVALIPLARWSRYSSTPDLDAHPALGEDALDEREEEDAAEPPMGLGMALLPYGVLTVLSVIVLAIPPVTELLSRVAFGPSFPEVATGLGVVTEAEEQYEPFEPLSHPGGLLILATVIAFAVYSARGYLRTWRERSDPPPIWKSTLTEAAPASAAVVTFLILASIFSHSGQVDVLALGIASVTAAPVYAFTSAFIGIVGTLVTNSSTTSNILFAPLQDAIAGSHGISQSAVIAGQSAGGAIGNVVAPVNVVLGTSAAGIAGKEGAVIRKAALWLLPVAVLTGLATLPFIFF